MAFIFLTPSRIKNKALDLLGTNDLSTSKSQITSNILRYVSVFDKKATYPGLYKVIWSTKFDPKDPDSGWASRIHKRIFPLKGNNSEIIPDGSIGYQMDSTTNGESWNGNAYSFSVIGNNKVSSGDTLCASVFCFVSKEFNGTWVILISEGATIGNTKFDYDLKYKDTWQKLSIKVLCNEGDAPVYLYFSKYGTTDFSSLTGHVIFAYPQVNIIRKTGETVGNSGYNDISKGIGKLKLSPSGSDAAINSNIPKQTNIAIENNVEHFTMIGENIYVNFSNSFKNSNITNQLSLLSFSLPPHSKFYDQDLIRNWIARIVSEDSVYYGYKSDLKTDKISSIFYNDRLVRWQFAWQIFTKEYNWRQKIFGGGFNFLNWYGYYFLKDKTIMTGLIIHFFQFFYIQE